ncbi:MAG: MBL fold metallo-hydrolase [Alphaproteobacteria bacterium]|nr:MBL fold metallo-hydrolase [Alphaproteobacteria bacterium]
MPNPDRAELRFLGAAQTVTGSCLGIATAGGRLLVDCGMFQGPKALQGLNWAPLAIDPASLDALILTHAHIDHVGLVPRLVAEGFRRRAFATPATCDLLRWVLIDAGAIQESEAERSSRRNERRDQGTVKPLYTVEDAERSLHRLVPTALDAWFEPMPAARARLRNAGHILGSAWVELELHGAVGEAPLRVVVSGDIGPRDKTLSYDPQLPEAADVLVIEGTYGNRERAAIDEEGRRVALGAEVREALAAGGNLVIPAFAVERSQELIHDLLVLQHRREIPPAPIFLDSPLAHRATEVFRRRQRELEVEAGAATAFDGPTLHVVESVDQSKAIGRLHSGAIIIAGSGMCDAGRVKHHLKDNLWRTESTVLFVGYQVPGTLGHVIRSGTERVRIHGEEIAVKARIRSLDVYSGHADANDLLAWAAPLLAGVQAIFLVHGELDELAGLRRRLIDRGVAAERIFTPEIDDRFALRVEAGRLAVVPVAVPESERRAGPALRETLAAGRDWHNDYAAAVLAVRQALTAARGDAERHALLARLRRALEAAPPAGR